MVKVFCCVVFELLESGALPMHMLRGFMARAHCCNVFELLASGGLAKQFFCCNCIEQLAS